MTAQEMAARIAELEIERDALRVERDALRAEVDPDALTICYLLGKHDGRAAAVAMAGEVAPR